MKIVTAGHFGPLFRFYDKASVRLISPHEIHHASPRRQLFGPILVQTMSSSCMCCRGSNMRSTNSVRNSTHNFRYSSHGRISRCIATSFAAGRMMTLEGTRSFSMLCVAPTFERPRQVASEIPSIGGQLLEGLNRSNATKRHID